MQKYIFIFVASAMHLRVSILKGMVITVTVSYQKHFQLDSTLKLFLPVSCCILVCLQDPEEVWCVGIRKVYLQNIEEMGCNISKYFLWLYNHQNNNCCIFIALESAFSPLLKKMYYFINYSFFSKAISLLYLLLPSKVICYFTYYFSFLLHPVIW